MQTTTKTRKRRGPKHPGVVLIRPDADARTWWRARYVDPDSGKTKKVTLDASLTTAELRADWAVRKSKALARRRLELEEGAPRATGTALTAAVSRYYEDHPQLRERTTKAYKAATLKLEAWCAAASVASADDLTGPKLVAFRAALVKEPKRAHVVGGKRGERVETPASRSPHTVNRELRSIGTVLSYVRRLGLLPRLSSDELRDALRKLSVSTEQTEYLRPKDLQRLFEAALRHDATTFTATRAEHAGRRPRGSTLRYRPIAPFVAVVLLTGMRFGEAADLEWGQVDVDALDNDGKPVGEIYLTSATKTRQARTVGLEVSPALRKLLAAMKLKSGGEGRVFASSQQELRAAERRLKAEYGAPESFGWQMLRRTCGTYLVNSGGIFGASSAYRSAKQLGHSVEVAERHYVGVVRGIPRDVRNLEAAMQIETQLQSVIDAVNARQDKLRRAG